ncbi:hypothetical protein L1N85_10705 [Paenibacillus alkaliterrae]|uniref:hypothetical protein n=1 Tax=Paenibacillus alkaliterrae TaxID=320909 RepID=UPI001F2835F5|nr:hypothetical protein [Paenibacillus alkaliterrae]MCF2938906.1 hypothetical protein [Paenibacillus alkaliterrae]
MPTGGVDFRNKAGAGVVTADGLKIGVLTQPRVVVSTTITFDPPSLLTDGIALSSAIAITGAALGDAVELYPPYDTQGVIYQASVSSAGNIRIALHNASAGTVDLASGTWGVAVRRRT